MDIKKIYTKVLKSCVEFSVYGTAKTEGKVLPENEKQNRKKRQIKLKNGAYFPVMDNKLRFLLHCISINNWSGGPILIML